MPTYLHTDTHACIGAHAYISMRICVYAHAQYFFLLEMSFIQENNILKKQQLAPKDANQVRLEYKKHTRNCMF